MCWKQEWAMAIGNLNHAIEHIERAESKLFKRLQRNKANLPKSHDKKAVQTLIQKNSDAIERCIFLIVSLKEKQDTLFKLIHEYGINHSDSSEKLYKLMGTYPFQEKLKLILAGSEKSE
jgi:hypothetical protein